MQKINSLINAFWQICLLRRGPQDLPASTFLLSITAILAFGISIILNSLGAAILELLSLTLVTGGLLLFFGHMNRFVQTLTAIMGAGLIIGLIVTSIFVFFSSPPVLLRLAIFFWNLSILANILKHSLGVHHFHASLLALIYAFLINRLVTLVEGGVSQPLS